MPVGFNAWRESDGRLAIGEVTEFGVFGIGGADLKMRGIDAPPGLWECEDHEAQAEIVKRNLRGMLQLLGIKVYGCPDTLRYVDLFTPRL